MPVTSTRKEYDDAVFGWQRCRDCYDGGDAVKARGPEYLPPLDGHKSALGMMIDGKDGQKVAKVDQATSKYQEYKLRALFYNATGRTVDGLAGMIFQQPPKVTVPDKVKSDLTDITLGHVSAETFALNLTKEIIKTGRAGVLVDMDEDGTRPYWVLYKAEDIVSWLVEDDVLTRVVLREYVDDESIKDEFVLSTVCRYRVLRLSDGVYTQQLYVPKNADAKEYVPDEKVMEPARRSVPLDYIPFLFIGPTTISPDIEKPPMLDMVDVNLSHYRASADMKHGLHFTALPTPWVSGLKGNNDNAPLAIGAGKAWVLGENGKAGMLEFSGSGLAAIKADMDKMETMMATLGARLLEPQNLKNETATAVMMRHTGEHATLRTIAGSVELALSTLLKWHSWWMGNETKPEDTKAEITLNKDFFATKMTSGELKDWIFALQSGKVSYKTFYSAFQRGDLARPGVTAEQELKDISAETPEPLPAPKPGAADDDVTG